MKFNIVAFVFFATTISAKEMSVFGVLRFELKHRGILFSKAAPQKTVAQRMREIRRELLEGASGFGNQNSREALEAELIQLSGKDSRSLVEQDSESRELEFQEPESKQYRGFVPGIQMATKGSGSGSGSENKNSGFSEDHAVSGNSIDLNKAKGILLTRRDWSRIESRTPEEESSFEDPTTEIPSIEMDFIPCYGSTALEESDTLPELLSLKKKAQRGFRNLLNIIRNKLVLKVNGFTGLLLQEAQWPEACCRNHPFVADKDGAEFLNAWKKGFHGTRSFQEVSHQRLPSVIYLTPEQRNLHRVHVVRPEGKNAYLMLNEQVLRNFEGIFVMGSHGEIYIGRSIRSQFHHSSFFAGGAVAWAGDIKTNALGEIIDLSNESGHYKAGVDESRQGLRALALQGVDLNQVVFELIGTGSCLEPSYNALEFLEFGLHCQPMTEDDLVTFRRLQDKNSHAGVEYLQMNAFED
ncbi:MAG: hypothetical protein WCK49_03385 [Myxococcaceae bacterium]